MERARDGDRDAFAALVRAHQAVALRVAYVTCGTHADAEEAVQDGFVKAYRALERFRPDAPFRPWLLTIVANEARNRRRSAGRRAAVALRAQSLARAGADPSPEAAVIDQEEARRVLAAVDRLPDHERIVVAYRHLVGLSEQETARALGIRLGTVKSRLSRGLARLRTELPEEVIEGA